MVSKKINKNLHYPVIPNFGDDLNGELFRIVFGVDFNHTQDLFKADFTAIGSSLGGFIYNKFNSGKKDWLKTRIKLMLNWRKKFTKITVLGTGFWNPVLDDKVQFIYNMDFKFVRGKLTEKILLKNKLIKEPILTGDLGLLAPYVYPNKFNKKYRLGIVAHLDDLDSPILYDIYKKHISDSIYINVKEKPEKVINDIKSCRNIVSTSLHGLIVADSFNIPNLWLENKYKRINKSLFKYYDYYSSFNIMDIHPVQAIDFLNSDITSIEQSYRIDINKIKEKQREVFEFCKKYLAEI